MKTCKDCLYYEMVNKPDECEWATEIKPDDDPCAEGLDLHGKRILKYRMYVIDEGKPVKMRLLQVLPKGAHKPIKGKDVWEVPSIYGVYAKICRRESNITFGIGPEWHCCECKQRIEKWNEYACPHCGSLGPWFEYRN